MAGKIERYREQLRACGDWEAFMLAESNLPGPRGNLELLAAFVAEAPADLIRRYARLTPDEAPNGTAREFLATCGAAGLGRLLAEAVTGASPNTEESRPGQEGWPPAELDLLRHLASDPRWRVREGVAMALQALGDADTDRMLEVAEEWAAGEWYEQRAAAAGVCEPRLLRDTGVAGRVLCLLDVVTSHLAEAPADARRSEPYRVLRQAMAYCWSVALAADMGEGRPRFESWIDRAIGTSDRDVAWLLKENLKKKRLLKADPDWTGRMLLRIETGAPSGRSEPAR